MRLARYAAATGPRLGIVMGNTLYDLPEAARMFGQAGCRALIVAAEHGNVIPILELEEVAAQLLSSLSRSLEETTEGVDSPELHPLSEVRLLPAIRNPGKILCLARNYYEGRDRDSIDKSVCTPRIFMKPSSSLIGPHDEIHVPPLATVVCPEIEMTAVIGKRGRDIPEDEADDYIAAYTILNDFSARKLDLPPERMGQPWDGFFDWLNGKWFDTFAAMGPWLTFKSAVGDTSDLQIRCTANENVWTQGSTADMIFTPAETIAFISQIMTLEPGDVIATGVPVHEKEQEPIKSGDVIEGEIEGLGRLRNRVVFAE